MPQEREKTSAPAMDKSLRDTVARYQKPNVRRSTWQVINTFVPYVALWYLMIQSMAYSYWITLALALLAGGLLVRIFIILHDCGHGSFFPSQRLNNIVGSIAGVLTFTPYFQWRHDHAMHHATTSDLDRRGWGDVHTLTVNEYLAMSRWKQFQYRTFRHPLLMLSFGPAWAFIISQRFPLPHSKRRERLSVHGTNLALIAIVVAMGFTIGVVPYLLIQLPVALFGATLAVWLFYCQHQFEGTYWARHEEWSFEEAAIHGSSFFRMSRVMQWFTGNIGYHHVHHLSPRIPNYNLEDCHNAHPRFQDATVITFWSSREFFALKLWDEERKELVGLGELRNKSLPQADAI